MKMSINCEKTLRKREKGEKEKKDQTEIMTETTRQRK